MPKTREAHLTPHKQWHGRSPDGTTLGTQPGGNGMVKRGVLAVAAACCAPRDASVMTLKVCIT